MSQEIAPVEIETQMRLAEIMVTGKVMIPKHLQDSSGDCLAVIMQAAQWRMNPFVVAQKTFLINGKLGYEAQLVAAVINTNAPIKDRIEYQYIGEWEKYLMDKERTNEKGLAVRAFVELKSGKTVDKTVYLSTVTTRNSTNWRTDPQQQLGYQAAVRLARQHFPEVLLGVYIPDELEGIEPNESGVELAHVVKNFEELSNGLTPLGITLRHNGNVAIAEGNTHTNVKTLQQLGFKYENGEYTCACLAPALVSVPETAKSTSNVVDAPLVESTTTEDDPNILKPEIETILKSVGLEVSVLDGYVKVVGNTDGLEEMLNEIGIKKTGKGWVGVVANLKVPQQTNLFG